MSPARSPLVEADSETILLEIDNSQNSIHNGGALVFGADGKLYWAMVLAAPEPAPRTAGAQGGFTWGAPFPFMP